MNFNRPEKKLGRIKFWEAAAALFTETVEEHFIKQIELAGQTGDFMLTPVPSHQIIEAVIDAAFWASLRREEGRSPKISLALLPPDQASQPLLFEKRLALTPKLLTKIAPGFERPGVHLGVWHENDCLYVWGTTRQIPNFCLVLDVSEPGLLVVKHRQADGFGKFVNVAVLIGDQVKIIDESSINLPDSPAMLSSLLGLATPSSWFDSVNVLVQMAVSMRAHGRGGSLLVVPSESKAWRSSIMHPMLYAVSPVFSGLADLMHQEVSSRSDSSWQSALRREVDRLAGLTAIDGTTIISDKYELLGFGAKIQRPLHRPIIDKIIMTEPILGGDAIITNVAQSGGTRHLSAAQFVSDQRDALALVASQDGRFTVFTWSPTEDMVHGHRIDTLLL